VVLSVYDPGIGINPDDIERIFDIFYSTKLKGFGMGLPLAFFCPSEVVPFCVEVERTWLHYIMQRPPFCQWISAAMQQ
jgi:hypothetical protein